MLVGITIALFFWIPFLWLTYMGHAGHGILLGMTMMSMALLLSFIIHRLEEQDEETKD